MIAVLVALVLVTLSASLLGGKVFTSGDNILLWPPFSAGRPADFVRPSNVILTDPVTGLNPDLLQIRADLLSETLPLWNPYVGAGRPLLASQSQAPLFPLTWLAFVLPFWSSLAWIAAAKILLAAGGVYLFCRELELCRGPSLLGAVAFAFGTYFVVWLEHPQTNVWALLPWIFFAIRRVCTRGNLGATALLGAFSGLSWLGGHPESSAFLLGAAVAYATFELLAESRRGPSRVQSAQRPSNPRGIATLRGRTCLVIGGLVLGLGVSAVVNLPLIELLSQSGKTTRGGPGFPFSTGWSFFFPELWGNPSKAFSGGPSNFNERTAYIGALPLLLALGTLGRRRPREQWFFVGLAIVLLATVFGTPAWASAVRNLPGGNVAALGRLLIIVSFAGAVLASYGLQRWITGSPHDRKQMLWIMGIAAAFPALTWLPRHVSRFSDFLAAIGQLPAVQNSEGSPGVIALASASRWGLVCAVGLGALAVAGRRRSAALAIGAAVVLTGVDLVALDRGYHGSIPLARANPPVPASIHYLQQHQGDARITTSGIEMPANLGEHYGLRDARVAIDIPYPTRYRLLWTALGGIGGDQEFFIAGTPNAHRLADVFAARYVLLSPGERTPAWLHPVFHDAGGTVALNATALPRAWVAYDWRRANGQPNALALTLQSTTRALRDHPVIEGAPPPPSDAAPAPTMPHFISDGAESVSIEAVARRPGYLILDDSAYPGWTASVDAHAVRWQRANDNFRAVPIPAGPHVVSFRYRPPSVLVGAIVTLLCAIALAGLAAVGARARRRDFGRVTPQQPT